MKEEPKTWFVLGHKCSGMLEHQDFASESDCIPRIMENGRIKGCDDDNTILIKFCPYCGDKLINDKDL